MGAFSRETSDAEWDRLAHALNRYGIRHVAPLGRPRASSSSDPTQLFRDLNTATEVRLREAAIFLLLTHPDLAPAAQHAISELCGRKRDRAMRRYIAACALQRMWRTRIQLALGEQATLPAKYLDELGLPPLESDYGRATLWALAAQEEARYGYDAWAGYTSLMDLFLNEIALNGWGQRATRAG